MGKSRFLSRCLRRAAGLIKIYLGCDFYVFISGNSKIIASSLPALPGIALFVFALLSLPSCGGLSNLPETKIYLYESRWFSLIFMSPQPRPGKWSCCASCYRAASLRPSLRLLSVVGRRRRVCENLNWPFFKNRYLDCIGEPFNVTHNLINFQSVPISLDSFLMKSNIDPGASQRF